MKRHESQKSYYEDSLLEVAFNDLDSARRNFEGGYWIRAFQEFEFVLENAIGYYVHKAGIKLKPIAIGQSHYMMIRGVFWDSPNAPQELKSLYARLMSWATMSQYDSDVEQIGKEWQKAIEDARSFLEDIKKTFPLKIARC